MGLPVSIERSFFKGAHNLSGSFIDYAIDQVFILLLACKFAFTN